MSPFSQQLHGFRISRGLRQADLADLLGYEQSYISALEVGLKGPPTNEFIERLVAALSLTSDEQERLYAAAGASQRKLTLDLGAPSDMYWLVNDLRAHMSHLSPVQVRMIRDIIKLKDTLHQSREPMERVTRRKKEEAAM